MKKLLALLLLAAPCFANGPKYVGSDANPSEYQEFLNVYHDLQFPQIATGTAQNFTIVNASISVLNITGSLTGVSTLTVTGYMSWPKGMVIQSTQCINNVDVVVGVSQTFADTKLSCTITPKLSTSIIRITYWHHCTANNNGTLSQTAHAIRIVAGASTVLKTQFGTNSVQSQPAPTAASGIETVCTDTVEYSPGSTASLTIKTQDSNYQGVGSVGILDNSRGNGAMLLQEISYGNL